MNTSRIVRIGTRESALALFQALAVQQKLNSLGVESEIIEITSDGDIDLVTPLYEMGIQGIFTKSLDTALLQNRIDVAVHSTKDIPTKLAKGLLLSAVLERASPYDCLVLRADRTPAQLHLDCRIATSSLRRKMQWLSRYPHHSIENLRGNIQTRLEKLNRSNWQGAIFAEAAMERLGISSHPIVRLDWMLPSPAQGAIGIVCRQDDHRMVEICSAINHRETNICISAERSFLSALHGGCAVPIAAYAMVKNETLFFKGNIFSLNAKEKCEVELTFNLDQAPSAGDLAAHEIIRQGGDIIIKTFRP